jgi:uncharacterized protein (AIM24 family)
MSGPFSNIGAKIINKNGCDTLECTMEPGASLITNQDTMSYMEGGIVTKVTSGSSGLGGMFRRAITDSSFFQNAVTNTASIKQTIVLSPLMQGAIVEIVIQPGETWRFANKTFLACSPNLQVSGNLNIFRNFRMSFVNGNLTYVTITAPTEVGVVWVTGYGGVTKHEIIVGLNSIPLLINNGCFLGMIDNTKDIDYWKDYTTLTTPGGLFSSFMTDIGFVMKVGEKNPLQPLRGGKVICTVYTQTLNPHAFEKYIEGIARRESGGTSVKGEVAEGVATGIFSLFSGGRRRTRRINRRKR